MTTKMTTTIRKRARKMAMRKVQRMVWVKRACRLDNGVTPQCHQELETVSRKGMRTAEICSTSYRTVRARVGAAL